MIKTIWRSLVYRITYSERILEAEINYRITAIDLHSVTFTDSRLVSPVPFLPELVWTLLACVYVKLNQRYSLFFKIQLMEKPVSIIRWKKRK